MAMAHLFMVVDLMVDLMVLGPMVLGLMDLDLMDLGLMVDLMTILLMDQVDTAGPMGEN